MSELEDKCEIVKRLVGRGIEDDTLEFVGYRSLDSAAIGRLARVVGAFANTNGGHILIGIREAPTLKGLELVGIDSSEFDARRIHDSMLSLMEPKTSFQVDIARCSFGVFGLVTVEKSKYIIHVQGEALVRVGPLMTLRRDPLSRFQTQSSIQDEKRSWGLTVVSLAVTVFSSLAAIVWVPPEGPMAVALISLMVLTVVSFANAMRIRVPGTWKHRVTRLPKPLVLLMAALAEFGIAYYFLGPNLGLFLLLAMLNFVIVIVLGAAGLLKTSRVKQWSGMMCASVLLALGLVLIPESMQLSDIAVEITGVFIGILVGASLSETWKALDEKRSSRATCAKLIEELSSIRDQILRNEPYLVWPVWESVIAEGSFLRLDDDVARRIANAYQAVMRLHSHATVDNRQKAIEGIDKVVQDNRT